MKFLYPYFLSALVVLLIPLIIHIFHFKRYKTVFFSQVGFLKAVQQDTKKKSDLKKRLILLSRLLLLASLVLAFSQPYLPVSKKEVRKSNQAVAIYLDNSFSMNRESASGPILEQAKNKVISIANSYGPGTNFLLLTNDAKPQSQIPVTREQLLQQLSTIRESSKSLSLNEAHQLLMNGLSKFDKNTNQNCYLLSDFQSHLFDIENLGEDSLCHNYLVCFSSPIVNNLMIDSCWFESPGRKAGQQEKLFVKIINQSDQSIQNQPIRLSINDSLKAISDLNLEAGQEKVIELNFRNNTHGFHRGMVQLDDYPVIYDNTFYFSYEVKTRINSLLIHNPEKPGSKNIQALFFNDPFIHFDQLEEKHIQPNHFGNIDFVMLLSLNNIGSGMTKLLVEFVKNGGTLCVFPGEQANTNDYNQLYTQLHANQITGIDTTRLRMSYVNYNHPVFQEVFERPDEDLQLPEIGFRYRFSNFVSANQQELIRLINGNPSVVEYPFEKGHLYNFSFPLLHSNESFMHEAIFVPLIYNMALNSLEPQAIFFTMKNPMLAEVRKEQTDTSPFELRQLGSTEQFRVSVLNENLHHARLDFSNLIEQAGFYELNSDDKTIKIFAFNFNRNESKNDCLSADAIREKINENKLINVEVIESELTDFDERIREINDGIELWYLFILLTLLFTVIETAIIRWMK